ncbi:MAG: thioredoxin [Acidiferrobacterales bacterium]
MNASPHIYDVNQHDFVKRVLDKSREIPVLVDFWAPWCGPCHMLAPLLARLAEAYDGKFVLAKVNTDLEQELAMQYGIRSLPTVKLFRDAEVVDEFIGVLPESRVRQLLEQHLPRESDAVLENALAAYRAGETDEALDLLRNAIDTDPANDHVKIELAKLYLEQSRLDDAQQVLGKLSVKAKAEPAALVLQAWLGFARIAVDAPTPTELEKAIAADADNCEARSQLSAQHVLAKDYESALHQLLEIVKRNRGFRDDAGRKRMLAIFDILGTSSELVSKYRNLLATALN